MADISSRKEVGAMNLRNKTFFPPIRNKKQSLEQIP